MKFAYVARSSCGCVRAVVVDDGNAFTADAVAEFIRDEYAVDRVSVDDARLLMATGADCRHQAEPARQEALHILGQSGHEGEEKP